MMIKAVGYAYPTSVIASQLGAKETGCWYVATYGEESDCIANDLIGPFASMQLARGAAYKIKCRWSRFSK